MTAKIITSLILLLINIAAAAFFLMMLLLALNGFSERDTTASLLIYFIGVLLIAAATVTAAYFSIGFLTVKKNFNPILSALAVTVFFSVIIVLADFVLIMLGALVASEVRNSYLR